MANNPILAAKLEFLATAITGIAVQYAQNKIDDDTALEAVSDVLEAFTQPVKLDAEPAEPASATA